MSDVLCVSLLIGFLLCSGCIITAIIQNASKPIPVGKLVLLTDEVDGEKDFALEMSEYALSQVKEGDQVILEAQFISVSKHAD